VHPGLVILVPNVGQEKQVLLFREAMERLAQSGDNVNKVLEVDTNEEDITLTVYDYPAKQRSP
jgi:hypothetical protein